jgi:hypothetical protein
MPTPESQNPESYAAWMARIDRDVDKVANRRRKASPRRHKPVPPPKTDYLRLLETLRDLISSKHHLDEHIKRISDRLAEVTAEMNTIRDIEAEIDDDED